MSIDIDLVAQAARRRLNPSGNEHAPWSQQRPAEVRAVSDELGISDSAGCGSSFATQLTAKSRNAAAAAVKTEKSSGALGPNATVIVAANESSSMHWRATPNANSSQLAGQGQALFRPELTPNLRLESGVPV